MKLLKEHAERVTKGLQLLPLPLYGGLPYSEQVLIILQSLLNSWYIYCSDTSVSKDTSKFKEGS